jgi:L-arabinose isomerase
MAGIEIVFIDKETRLRDLKNQLRWNEVYYQLNKN